MEIFEKAMGHLEKNTSIKILGISSKISARTLAGISEEIYYAVRFLTIFFI